MMEEDGVINTRFDKIAVNMGAGTVGEGNGEEAEKNMQHFIIDCPAEELLYVRAPKHDHGGRFAYLVYRGTRCHLVLMPGLRLEKVRYMGGSAWGWPRLYVDEISWLWVEATYMLSERAFALPEEWDDDV